MQEKLKGADMVNLLAAKHCDDVSPTSLYYDTNVGGMKNTLKAMKQNGVKRIVFFSSVAVYGLNKKNPNERIQPTRLTITERANGRQSRCFKNGIKHTMTGILT